MLNERCSDLCRLLVLVAGFPLIVCAAEPVSSTAVTAELIHLRSGDDREWSDFPGEADGTSQSWSFRLPAIPDEATLEYRQQDVKQRWNLTLNGKVLAPLVRDENDMVIALPIPNGLLRETNELLIEPVGTNKFGSDDIRVGEITVHHRSIGEVLDEGTVHVQVLDADSGEGVPGRITILNQHDALQTVFAEPASHLAVRPGTVYTSTGEATFGLPAGTYTLYAGRGFEYTLAKQLVVVSKGMQEKIDLSIRRVVPTEGWVACDTHVHTLTHSGHGDASVEERMVTLAGEGVELPIATDHNVVIDHTPYAEAAGVSDLFTPVVGCEVTTRIGHFNVFPLRTDHPTPATDFPDWGPLFDEIYRAPDVRVVILNHARDLHSGFRPFGPEHYLNWVAMQREGWPLRFNAMEVINSGATQSQPLELLHDWMALLNSGHWVAPIGCSDSHDVARHFVGQGRTYIQCDDSQPGQIGVDAAARNLLAGRVNVSYGLLAELTVADRYGPGDLVPVTGESIPIRLRVLGPPWVTAERLTLYSNGEAVREWEIARSDSAVSTDGVLFETTEEFVVPPHDVHLVAVATGPGIEQPYWRTAKPYQPTNPNPKTIVWGSSGAVRLDASRDGRWQSARDEAIALLYRTDGAVEKTLRALEPFDRAVAMQVAHLLIQPPEVWEQPELQQGLDGAARHVREAFMDYRQAWRDGEVARMTLPRP